MLNVSSRRKTVGVGHFRSCLEKLYIGPNREARRITRKPGVKRVIMSKGHGPHQGKQQDVP